MEGRVYKIIEIVGTSPKSWEDATNVAVETACQSLEDLRIAEVLKMDVTIDNGAVTAYRVRLNVSFKYHPEGVAAAKTPPAPKKRQRAR